LRTSVLGALLVALGALVGCEADGRQAAVNASVSSCMQCHNGATHTDYAGPGVQNPHPFPGADDLSCTVCHGGNPEGTDKETSHVPPPPEIGDRENQRKNRHAFFNRLTLTGIDKFPDYEVDGTTYTALQYLQFVNPGDLRVVNQGLACGMCHQNHAATVSRSVLATEAGILSGARFAIGADNAIPGHEGLFEDTAADYAFRAVVGPQPPMDETGAVASLLEYPVYSTRGADHEADENQIDGNPRYDSENLDQYVLADGRVETGSPLANLFHEQVAFTCGDCHLGSAGANNRYGDFRSSGCTACHMPYSLDGRSRSRDPNVPKDEPRDPDDIDPGERPHVRSHRIISTYRTLENGETVPGIDDYACAGCHQGSNRTVMQYWGIRLDQNQDVRRGNQYPSNPKDYETTRNDARLFDPLVRNRTFNGRNHNQYLLFEDYDGDGRDDTPPDVHYEAGMGCIDCHGSYDLHGGDVKDGDAFVRSRMEQHVAVSCESCHGSAQGYAGTVAGTAFDGRAAQLAVDGKGNALDHVVREDDGHLYLYSRLTGKKHYVPQTRDTVVDSGVENPLNGKTIYSTKASFAMGRDDGDPSTGLGPHQGGTPTGFAHADSMDCASCHAAWTNTCMGCHLEGEYDRNNNFSNVTGERIVFEEDNADFVYQSPVFFQLGVNSRNKITQTSSNTKTFFKWKDRNNRWSRTFAFSDRNGKGANPAHPYGALGHNALMAHSIRGRVDDENEGPRYCVACHLTREGLEEHGALYESFRDAMANNRFGELPFETLKVHIGENPGNRLNSPLWVHMVAGLGSGLFLFDENGCPVNPLDKNDDRKGCENRQTGERRSPADRFDLANILTQVKFNLDRVVDRDGRPHAASNHALLEPGAGPNRRGDHPDANPNMAGPLGADLIRRLTDPATGIVLDAWFDADGVARGTAPGAAPPSPPPPAEASAETEEK